MAKQLNVNMKFTADTSQAKSQLQELQTSLNKITSGTYSPKKDIFPTDKIREATDAATSLRAALETAINVDTGKLDLKQFNNSLKQSGSSLSDYAKHLNSLGPEGQKAFSLLSKSILQAEVPLKRASKLVEEFKTSLLNTARWQLSSSVLHGFMGALQSAYGYAQDLNRSLNDIRIVTGYGTDEMARFAEEANKAAKSLSTTTTNYTNASLIYYQQGLDTKEVKERTDITIKMANAAGQSAEVVSDQMTAVWNNFDNGSKSLEYYADVMTALGAATASSTDEIAAGLEKFAAVSENVGLSYEYATAALATVTSETRQSAEVVGTAFKTMFARIQGLELGETLEDGTTLNEYSEALMKVGINIKDANGELKTMDNILREMAGVWQTLKQDEQVALAEKVAGVRQYNQMSSLMNSWDVMEKNLQVAYNSEGTLQEQADIYAESWEAAEKRVRASMEDIFDSVLEDKTFINLTNALADLVDFIGTVVDGMGGMKGVILVVGQALLKSFGPELSKNLDNFIQRTTMTTEKLQAMKQKNIEELTANIDDSTPTGSVLKENLTQQMNLSNTLVEKQQELERKGLQLSEVEEKRARIIMDQTAALGEQVLKYAQIEETSKKQISSNNNWKITRRSKIEDKEINNAKTSSVIRSAGTELKEQAQKNLMNFNTMDAKELHNTLNTLSQVFDSTKNKINEMNQELTKTGQSKMKPLLKLINDMKTAIDGLSSDKDIIDEKNIEQSRQKIAQLLKLLDEIDFYTSKGPQALMDLMDKKKGLSEGVIENIDQMEESARNYGQSLVQGAQGSAVFEKAVKKNEETLKGFGKDTFNVSNGIVSMSEAFMGFAGSVNAIKSIVSTFDDLKNGAVSTSEGITQLITGFTMLGTSGVQTFQALSAAATALNIALWEVTLIVVAVVAAITAVTAAIQGLNKMWNAETIAAEKAKKTAEGLSKALKNAKEEVEGIKEAFQGYDDLLTKLDNCTKGTQEWYDTLAEVNEKIHEIIQAYPELLNYQNLFNSDGTLNADTLEKFQDDREKNSERLNYTSTLATASSALANSEAKRDEIGRTQSNFKNTLKEIFTIEDFKDIKEILATTTLMGTGAGLIPALGGLYVANKNELVEKADKDVDTILENFSKYGEDALSTESIQKALNIESLTTETENYINSIRNMVKANDNAKDSLVNASKVVVADWANSEKGKELLEEQGINRDLTEEEISAIGNQMSIKMEERKQYWIDRENEANTQMSMTDASGIFDEWNRINGTSYTLKSNGVKGDKDNRTFEYYDSVMKDYAIVTLDQIATEIAAQESLESLGQSAQRAADFLNNIRIENIDVRNDLKKFISDRSFENMDQSSIKELFGDDFSKYENNATLETQLESIFNADITDIANMFGYTAEELEKFYSFVRLKMTDYQASMSDILDSDQFSTKTQEAFKAYTANNPERFQEYSVKEAQALATAFETAFSSTGSKGLANVVTLMEGLGEESDEFAGALSNINWQTVDVNTLKDSLKTAGVTVENLSDEQLQTLIDSMYDIGEVGESVEATKDKFIKLQEVMEKLEQTGDTISEEDWLKLDADIRDQYFMEMIDGTYMLTGKAEDFKKAVSSIKFDALDEDILNYKKSVDKFSTMKDLGYDKLSTQASSNDIASAQIDYLDEYSQETDATIQEYREALATTPDFDYASLAQKVADLGDQTENVLADYEAEVAEAEQLLESYTIEYFRDALPKGLSDEKVEQAISTFAQEIKDSGDLLSQVNSQGDLDRIKEEIKLMAESFSDAGIALEQTEDILGRIRSGELNKDNIQEDEVFKNLNSQLDSLVKKYPQLANEASIVQNAWLVGTEDYIEALEIIQDQLYGVQIANESAIAEVVDLQMELEQMDEEDHLVEFMVDVDTSEFDEKMAAIAEKEYTVDVIVHSEAEQEFDSVSAGIQQIEDHASKIGENYVVAAEDLRELNQVFPGILQGMKQLEDGSIELNKTMVQKAMQSAEAEIQIDAQKTIQQLQTQKTYLLQKQAAYRSISESLKILASGEVTDEEDAAKQKENISNQLTIIEEANSQLSADAQMVNNEEVATSSNLNAQTTAQNWANAWSSASYNAWQFADSAIKNMNAVQNGGGSLSNPSVRTIYVGGNGTTQDATLGETTEKQIKDPNTSQQDLLDTAALYDQLANNLQSTIDDIDGMQAEIGASAKSIDLSLGDVSKGDGFKTVDDRKKENEEKKKKEEKKKEYDPKLKNLEDELDRWHEINEEIEDLERNLQRVQKAKDRAFGKEKLALFDKEIKEINKNIDGQKEKLKEVKTTVLYDQARLNAFGAKYDSETGRVTNYDEMMARETALYNAAELTGDEKIIEAAKLRFDDFKKVMSNYESSLDELRDTEDKIQDYVYEKADLKLAKIEYEVEVNLNINEDDLEYIEYQLKKLEDQSYNQAQTMTLLSQKADELVEKAFITQSGLNDLFKEKGVSKKDQAAINNGTISSEALAKYDFTEDEINFIRDSAKDLLGVNEDLMEVNRQMLESLVSYWEEANKEMDSLLKRYDYYNSMVDTFVNWVDLIGASALGYSKSLTAGMKLVQVETGKKSIEGYQTALETEKNNETEYRKKLKKAKKEKDEDDIKYWQDMVNKSEERQADLQQQILDTTSKNITLVMEAYQEKMEGIFESLEKKMSGVYDNFQHMSEVFDRESILRDQYIPEYKQLYELTKLNRQLDKELEKTNGVKNKTKLKELQKEINDYMASGKKMSEYDLEYLQKKYDLKLAEVALEESQNSKSKVRLSRDNEGTWGYVYTADEIKTDDMVQKYEDSLYAIQDLNETYINETSAAYIKTQQEMMEALSSIQLSDYASFADYKKAVDETAKFYQDRLNFYSGEMGKVIDNNNILYNSDIVNTETSYTEKMRAGEGFITHFSETILGGMLEGYGTLEGYTQTLVDNIGSWNDENSILGQLSANWKSYKTDLDGVFKTIGISLGVDGEGAGLLGAFIATVGGKDEKNVNTILGRLGLLGDDGKISLDKLMDALGVEEGLQKEIKDLKDKGLDPLGDVQKGVEDLGGSSTKLDPLATSVLNLYNAINDNFGDGADKDKKGQDFVDQFGSDTLDVVYGEDGDSGVYGGLQDTKNEVGNLADQIKEKMPEMTDDVDTWATNYENSYKKVIKSNEDAYDTYSTLYDKLAATYVDPQNTTTNTIITKNVIEEEYKTTGSPSTPSTTTTSTPSTTTVPTSTGRDRVTMQDWANAIFGVVLVGAIAKELKKDYQGDDNLDKNDYVFSKGGQMINGTQYKDSDYLGKIEEVDFLKTKARVSIGGNSYWIPRSKLKGYDTGGYTGVWGSDGRLALLHEKELVLNKQDTANMLSAIDVVRGLVNNLEFKAAQQMVSSQSLAPARISGGTEKQQLEQNVTISASFPGVQDHNEIETAINDLMNQASQYMNRY